MFPGKIHLLNSASKPFVIIASGNSMKPSIRDGDKLTVKPAARKFNKYDIVLFSKGDKLICHRLLKRITLFKKSYYIEKGDNSLKPGIVSEKNIIGKVMKVNKLPANGNPLPGIYNMNPLLSLPVFYAFRMVDIICPYYLRKNPEE